MKKYMKYIILSVCAIVIGVLCAVLFLNKDFAENVNAEEENTIDSTNIVEENFIEENSIVEDSSEMNNVEEQNVVSNELTENKVIEETAKKTETVYEQDNDVGSTDKKQEAINLVKEKWGQDDTVSFRCDSVTSNGEYIIAVVSKNGSGVKNYFKVNLEKKEVQIHY